MKFEIEYSIELQSITDATLEYLEDEFNEVKQQLIDLKKFAESAGILFSPNFSYTKNSIQITSWREKTIDRRIKDIDDFYIVSDDDLFCKVFAGYDETLWPDPKSVEWQDTLEEFRDTFGYFLCAGCFDESAPSWWTDIDQEICRICTKFMEQNET